MSLASKLSSVERETEGRLPFFQRFLVKQRFGQAVAEGRVRYLSAEGACATCSPKVVMPIDIEV
jgi:hypothetical protein